MVQVKKDACRYRSHYNNPIRQSSDAANTKKRRAEIAVTRRVLVTMASQPFTSDKDIIYFALCMEFITNMATTAFALVLINKV